ncbi:hypothetical protein GEMRC1_003947 [Eukaryota sp. GEM-RC1]
MNPTDLPRCSCSGEQQYSDDLGGFFCSLCGSVSFDNVIVTNSRPINDGPGNLHAFSLPFHEQPSSHKHLSHLLGSNSRKYTSSSQTVGDLVQSLHLPSSVTTCAIRLLSELKRLVLYKCKYSNCAVITVFIACRIESQPISLRELSDGMSVKFSYIKSCVSALVNHSQVSIPPPSTSSWISRFVSSQPFPDPGRVQELAMTLYNGLRPVFKELVVGEEWEAVTSLTVPSIAAFVVALSATCTGRLVDALTLYPYCKGISKMTSFTRNFLLDLLTRRTQIDAKSIKGVSLASLACACLPFLDDDFDSDK